MPETPSSFSPAIQTASATPTFSSGTHSIRLTQTIATNYSAPSIWNLCRILGAATFRNNCKELPTNFGACRAWRLVAQGAATPAGARPHQIKVSRALGIFPPVPLTLLKGVIPRSATGLLHFVFARATRDLLFSLQYVVSCGQAWMRRDVGATLLRRKYLRFFPDRRAVLSFQIRQERLRAFLILPAIGDDPVTLPRHRSTPPHRPLL